MTQKLREQLEREFNHRGILLLEPGFYDHQKFIAAEQEDPKYLAKYAAYVETLALTDHYRERVHDTVRRLSNYLYNQLKRDGRQGACIDISGAFARMLDEEKIWGYPVGGGVGIQFPGGVGPSHFGAISQPASPVTAGHMWVRVPPYCVVDISLALQPWEQVKRKLLPDAPALSDACDRHDPTVFELMDMDYIRWVRTTYGEEPTVGRILQNYPWITSILQQFPASSFTHGELHLSYVPVAIKMSDKNISGMKEPTLNGMSPADLYDDFKRKREG